MAAMNPLRRRMIEEMHLPNLSPVTRLLYCTRSPNSLSTSTGRPTGSGWRKSAPIRSTSPRPASLGRFQRRGLRPAPLLRRHARRHRNGRAHSLCTQAPAAAGNSERRRGGAVFRGRAEPQASHRADDGLPTMGAMRDRRRRAPCAARVGLRSAVRASRRRLLSVLRRLAAPCRGAKPTAMLC